ncbi:MAG: ABC transporter substrate-binding protein [Dictyoglomi bacterium]|nr:ABC transporter substrate-binding protein [Dictyoglomota bacterium]
MEKYGKHLFCLLLVFLLSVSLVSYSFSQSSKAPVQKVPTQYNSPLDYQRATGVKISGYKESPILSELVKQKKLPPLKGRLPKEPAVVEVVEEIGQYGGNWRRVYTGAGDTPGFQKISSEGLVIWNHDGTKILPNLARRWDISKDVREFTFYLRQGVKWSDGESFTADDIMFYYEDMLLNKEITPVFPSWMTTFGNPVKVVKIDDYTVRFTFTHPNVLFLENIACNGASLSAPRHYLKQFHPKYVSKEKLDELAKKENFQYWYQLFGAKASVWDNPELPGLSAWIPGSKLGAMNYVMERNPFYWKIDPAGNQLPYIDKITSVLVTTTQLITMNAISGDIDLQVRNVQWTDYPVLMENRAKGGYRVLRWPMALGSTFALMPNLNHKDPVLRKLFEDKKFRIALSLAINREEINQLCLLGVCEPRQATVLKECPYYTEGLEKLYAEYNPKRANEILDEIGLIKRDKDGFRLRPDGKTLAITIEIMDNPMYGPWPDICELVKKYWEDIGIKTAVKVIDRTLLNTRWEAAEFDVSGWAWGRGLNPFLGGGPKFVFPCDTTYNPGPLYGLWYQSRGKSGEEPKGDIRKAMDLFDQILTTTDKVKRLRLSKELISLSTENLWSIGTVGLIPNPVVVKENFRNVPEVIFSEHLLLTPRNAFPEQFFIKK